MAASRFEVVTPHVDRYTPDERTDRPALGAIHGARGTLLVEGGASVSHLSEFISQLERAGRPPIEGIALTHWHWDHSFGSAAIDLPVIAQADTAASLAIQAGYDWSDAALAQRVADGREIEFCAEMIRLEIPDRTGLRIVLPTVTYETEYEIDLGGVHAVLAHVGGDHAADSSVVFVPEERVLFLGDCLYECLHAPEPFLTVAGVRDLLSRLRRFDVHAAIEGHDPKVAGAQEYTARLAALEEAVDLACSEIATEELESEQAELVALIRRGERRRP